MSHTPAPEYSIWVMAGAAQLSRQAHDQRRRCPDEWPTNGRRTVRTRTYRTEGDPARVLHDRPRRPVVSPRGTLAVLEAVAAQAQPFRRVQAQEHLVGVDRAMPGGHPAHHDHRD